MRLLQGSDFPGGRGGPQVAERAGVVWEGLCTWASLTSEQWQPGRGAGCWQGTPATVSLTLPAHLHFQRQFQKVWRITERQYISRLFHFRRIGLTGASVRVPSQRCGFLTLGSRQLAQLARQAQRPPGRSAGNPHNSCKVPGGPGALCPSSSSSCSGHGGISRRGCGC